MERRLAAILAADVVGYTRLMGADETGTLERSQRASFVRPHKAAITDYVGGKNGGKPAFQTLSPSPRRLAA